MRTISEQQVITKTTYTADGTTDIYNVPFEYLSKAHVIVTADGEAADYEWLSDHAVKFNTPPQSGTLIIIERQTPYNEAFVHWTDGSVMFSDDLNNQLLQVLFVLQENKQALEGALSYDDLKGAYDALGDRITNLGDPIDPQDAVTYKIFLEEISELRVEVGAEVEKVLAAAAAAEASAEEARKHAQDYIPFSFGRFTYDDDGNLVVDYYGDADEDDIKFDEDGNITIYIKNSPKINVGRGRIVFKGEYSDTTQYVFYDCVRHNGSWWLHIGTEPTTAYEPLDEDDVWILFAAKGDQGPKGDKGDTGKGLVISGRYDTLETLQNAVTAPETGDAYSVGTESPYATYIWNGAEWVNHGALQGPKGDTGPQGETGPQGPAGTSVISAYFDENDNLVIETSDEEENTTEG